MNGTERGGEWRYSFGGEIEEEAWMQFWKYLENSLNLVNNINFIPIRDVLSHRTEIYC